MERESDKRTLDAVEVVLVGCGKMGSALAKGLIDAGSFDSGRLICVDANLDLAEELAGRLGARVGPAARSDERARLWLFAVKPKDVEGAITERRPEFHDGDLVVSIAAGMTLASLRQWTGYQVDLVRAMPNTPALLSRGITGLMAADEADPWAAVELFESVGSVVILDDEDHFDALTAVSGSGPAYVFVALEALADGAVKMGLDRQTARQLAVHTVAGAAALVEARPDTHTAQLKDEVASPGGTTIAGLAALEEFGFRRALIGAVEAAATRSRQMDDSQERTGSDDSSELG